MRGNFDFLKGLIKLLSGHSIFHFISFFCYVFCFHQSVWHFSSFLLFFLSYSTVISTILHLSVSFLHTVANKGVFPHLCPFIYPSLTFSLKLRSLALSASLVLSLCLCFIYLSLTLLPTTIKNISLSLKEKILLFSYCSAVWVEQGWEISIFKKT